MHEIFSLPKISEFWKQTDNTWGMCLPKNSIYHYTSSVMAVENILSSGELWMSKSTVMNDYTEIIYGIELIKEVFSKKESKDAWFAEISESISQRSLSSFADYFILSFSQNGNSRLLWDSYSNKNGYNIEFSKELISDFVGLSPYIVNVLKDGAFVPTQRGFKVSLKTIQDEFTIPGFSYEVFSNSVLYDKTKQLEIINEVVEYIERKKAELKSVDISLALSALMQSIPFFKDPSLRDEEEYRLVIKITPSEQRSNRKKEYLRNVQHYREKDNKLFPYIILKMRSKEYIKSVSLGYCNCDELSVHTMQDFLSTLSQNIEIKTPNYALRW
jgi:hypothetical protein